MSAAVTGAGFVWVLLLRWLEPGTEFQTGRVMRYFVVTWPARYLPGTLPYHATRVLAAGRFGASRLAVVASIAYEAVLQVGAAAAVGVAGVIIGLGIDQPKGGIYMLALAPLAVLPVFLQPRVLVPVADRVLTLARRQPLSRDAILTTRETLVTFLGYALAYTLNGLAFYLVTRSIVGPEVNLWLAIGVFNLASAAGVAVIFVPSGIGIREGVIVALLSNMVQPDEALLAAGAVRGISIIADLLPLATIVAFDLGSRSWRHISRIGNFS
jgi:uncharacterized membrane protein YbhN (UPF0104 family)